MAVNPGTDNQLYRRGETNPILCQVQTIQAVNCGDFAALSSGWVYRASDQTYTSLSAAQFPFVANFAGISNQPKVSRTAKAGTGGGRNNYMRLSSEGVFEFDCYATTLDVGTLVGPAQDRGSASQLDNQKVDQVTDRTRAIGVVEEEKDVAGTTKVKVR